MGRIGRIERGRRGKVAFSSKSGNADGPTTPFTAFRIENDDAGYRSGLAQLGIDDLNPGQVLIRAQWSSVNYKDALAGTGKGKILRRFPLVGVSMWPARWLPAPCRTGVKAMPCWPPAAASARPATAATASMCGWSRVQ